MVGAGNGNNTNEEQPKIMAVKDTSPVTESKEPQCHNRT